MILLFTIQTVCGQNQAGFEEYYYAGVRPSAAMVPRIYYQSRSGWYGEARYNYEKAGAYSVYAGRTFSREKKLSYSLTPMVGVVAESFQGVSLALNAELETSGVSFSSNLQYSVSALQAKESFFYSWSELGYQLTNNLYMGIALQQTGLCKTGNDWEPGVQLCYTWRKWRFPFYFFNSRHQNNLVLGITRDWIYGK